MGTRVILDVAIHGTYVVHETLNDHLGRIAFIDELGVHVMWQPWRSQNTYSSSYHQPEELFVLSVAPKPWYPKKPHLFVYFAEAAPAPRWEYHTVGLVRSIDLAALIANKQEHNEDLIAVYELAKEEPIWQAGMKQDDAQSVDTLVRRP